MPEGRIGRFFDDRGFGFIEPDAGGQAVFFHVESVRGLPLAELRPGTRVSYETEMGPRGVRARNVRRAEQSPREEPRPRGRGAAGLEYRFLNPYNFVRPLKVANVSAAPLLGRCPPPPHDRWVGLTGRIMCALTATTPLFVSDSEGVAEGTGTRDDPPDHYHYRFFSYGGKPAIPGSSIRGAVRGVFEAVTSSCFSVFEGNRRLSYHLPPGDALALVPARAVQRAGGWAIELLRGNTPLAIGQRPQGPQYAAWVMQYEPLQPSRTRGSAPGSPYSRRRKVDLSTRRLGERFQHCQALIELVEHPTRRFSFWNVVDIAPEDAPPLRPAKGSQQRVKGYLCITNQNIENKHDERLFFDVSDNPPTVSLPARVVQRYKELIADYQERHAAEVDRRRRSGAPLNASDGARAGLSWFVYERTDDKEALRDGDLVYAMLEGTPSKPEVKFIVPVSVPRVGYEHTIGELLDPGAGDRRGMAEACVTIDALCPACRVFGWVRAGAGEEESQVAYAGRVRFGHANLVGELPLDDPAVGIPLAVLSGPKPTTTRFYLAPKDGRPEHGLEDVDTGYDAKRQQRLRGRKFYRHQGRQLREQEYRSPGEARSDQNRTVHGVLASGSTFRFTVHFENLAAIELGALLWSLEMDGWHHRLGLGKPLGFGSARIVVSGLDVIDADVRYTSLDTGWRDVLDRKSVWTQRFERAMAERYGKTFGDLENLRDLKALLADDPRLPVHYPRPTLEPLPDGRNYEWFMGNKRPGRDAGPRLTLPLAEEDEAGLPLMDRYGKTPPSR